MSEGIKHAETISIQRNPFKCGLTAENPNRRAILRAFPNTEYEIKFLRNHQLTICMYYTKPPLCFLLMRLFKVCGKVWRYVGFIQAKFGAFRNPSIAFVPPRLHYAK